MLVPWVAGRVGEAIGLRSVFAMVAACFAGVLFLSRVATRVESCTLEQMAAGPPPSSPKT
jgi:fucose permease